jgi:SAM-dependent methyltransferase
MNPDEYTKLERIDHEHWFYRGKRAIVRHWIARLALLGAEDLLVDAGMGTGTWVREMAAVCRVCGVDGADEIIVLARPKIEAIGGQVLQANLDDIPLPDGAAAVVTALDVLEHLEDDRAAFRELIRITRPGGLVVITVPALMMLWSDWDVALHHFRRYTRRSLLETVSGDGLCVLRCQYFNSLVLPLIFAIRGYRKFFPPKPGAERAEDKIPAAPLNSLLHGLMVRPACWGWFHPPAGVSLLAVVQKT